MQEDPPGVQLERGADAISLIIWALATAVICGWLAIGLELALQPQGLSSGLLWFGGTMWVALLLSMAAVYGFYRVMTEDVSVTGGDQ